MSKEIIISVKEAETLIHKGSLILDRKEISSVNDNYRVKMVLNKENILELSNKSVILFSDVHKFEIYKSDEIAFVNHFRVPLGLLKVTDKTYESSKSKKEEQPSFIENEGYLKLRNGLLGMIHHKYEMQAFFEKDYNIEHALQSFQNLSVVRKQLITELLDKNEFPIMDVQSDKFLLDISKRIVWWGFFIKDKYLSKLNIEEESEVVEKSENKTVYRSAKHKSKDNDKVVSSSPLEFKFKDEAEDMDGEITKNKSVDNAKKHIETIVEELPSVNQKTKKELVGEEKNANPKAEEENAKKQDTEIKDITTESEDENKNNIAEEATADIEVKDESIKEDEKSNESNLKELVRETASAIDEKKKELVVEDKNDKPKVEKEIANKQGLSIEEKQDTKKIDKPKESVGENKTSIAKEAIGNIEVKDEPVKEAKIEAKEEKSNETHDKNVVEGEKKERIVIEEKPEKISEPEASKKYENKKEKPKAKTKKGTKAEQNNAKTDETVATAMETIKTESKTEIRIKEIRAWLGKFMKLDDMNLINTQLATIPQEIKDEVDFLLGYVLAASYYDRYKGEEFFLNNQYEAVVYENKDELYSWVSFFVSLFRQDMHQLYFVKSLNSQVNQLERLAYDLSLNKLDARVKVDNNIELKEIDRKELLSDYFELTKGENGNGFEIINLDKAKSVFENNLMKEKLPMIGMEKKSEYDNKGIVENYCMLIKNRVNIVYNIFPDAEVIFYIDKKSILNDELKRRNFKVKDIGSLIDDKKKVLLVFNNWNTRSSFMSLYAELLKGNKSGSVKKAVVVLLVKTNREDIRSIDFANEVKEQKAGFAQMLGVNVEIIVKDILSLDDAEVKRNLKNALKGYKVNEIEVIHDNFNNEKASWVLDNSLEYFVEKANQNYYSLFN